MEISFTEEAETRLEEIPDTHSEVVINAIGELRSKGFDKSNLKLIRTEKHGEIWRLKVKEGGRGGIDYRVFLDYERSCFVILTVMHRDNAYES